MSTYRCPCCRPRTPRMAHGPGGVPLCARCGERLERVPLIRPLPALAAALVSAGLGLAALAVVEPLPRSEKTLAALQVLPAPLRELVLSREPAPPRPADRVVDPASLPELLAELRLADRSWIPRAEGLADGRTRYLYRRRFDEPTLTVEQIQQRIRYPPDFATERTAIASLVRQLQAVGVLVVLGPPRKPRAAGEWDPAARTIRMRPDVVGKGSVEFARILNHEAIHVVQSCRQGGLAAPPLPLGLSTVLDPASRRHLQDPVYASASRLEIRLESEAYANQNQLGLGPSLLALECRRGG